MDEPDVDELEWMACQAPEEDDEAFLYESDDDLCAKAPEEIRPPSTADRSCRKRIWSDASELPASTDVLDTEERSRPSKQVAHSSKSIHSPPSPRDLGREDNVQKLVKDGSDEPLLPEEADPPSGYSVFRMASLIVGECIPVTAPSGDRVYAQFSRVSDSVTKLHAGNIFARTSKAKGLLLEPIEAMIATAERERHLKMCTEPIPAESMELKARQAGHANEQLWVEKYAPRSFTDLLSDEQTNREVLRWLKQWDSCVFGQNEKSSTSQDVLASLRRKSFSVEGRGALKFRKQDGFGGKQNSQDDPAQASTSSLGSNTTFSDGIIKQASHGGSDGKVLLMCGPPGLGKTTLAHIVAKHCGYRVVEINASDDRVASTLQGKILDAVQMKSVMGDCRPNCLIIDEIDGAMGGNEGRSALKHLIDIVSTKKRSLVVEETQTQDRSPKKSGKRKSAASSQSLVRPIICICNDLYAPALRALRQVARVQVFTKPSTSRVVTRLKAICNEEGYKTSVSALTTLAERTECDIRACLNTLQFLKRKGEPLASVVADSLVMGYKDLTTSILNVWGEIFYKREIDFRRLKQQIITSHGGQDHLQFIHLYDLLANHGDHELVIEGVHENLLHMRYQDSSLSKTIESLESICDSDIRSHRVLSKQQFFLNVYQPSTAITIRRLVAGPTREQIQWPRAFQRYRSDTVAKMETLRAWHNRMSSESSRCISLSLLSVEVLSSLLVILSPPLRPVAEQLYTVAEQETMKQLVDTMVRYGLTYRLRKMEHGKSGETNGFNQDQGEIQLDPPISSLVEFEGYKVPHRQLSTTIRQILGHKVELDKVCRESVATVKTDQHQRVVPEHSPQGLGHFINGKPTNDGAGISLAKSENKVHQPAVNNQKTEVVTQQEGQLHTSVPVVQKDEISTVSVETKTVRKNTYQSNSFFDRFRKGGQNPNQINTKPVITSQRDLRPILYKFHEGFTNAVRRPLLVRELL